MEVIHTDSYKGPKRCICIKEAPYGLFNLFTVRNPFCNSPHFTTLLKNGYSYSSTTMCQYWGNRLISEQYTDHFTDMSQ